MQTSLLCAGDFLVLCDLAESGFDAWNRTWYRIQIRRPVSRFGNKNFGPFDLFLIILSTALDLKSEIGSSVS